ncbi:MAG TPA: hypothetical protein ENJ18_17055 [Nannocystis exedens]|nr:hypothetical protein [Nannocystis exedens]
MTWSQESAEILTTVLRNSITIGRVVAMDVDIDAVQQDVLPADDVLQAVLYRRDEGAEARQEGAIVKRGVVTRVAGDDGNSAGHNYHIVFDTPQAGDYQVVVHWPTDGGDPSGTRHQVAIAMPDTDDGLLHIREHATSH